MQASPEARNVPGGPVPFAAMHNPGFGPGGPNFIVVGFVDHDIRCNRCGTHYAMSCSCDRMFPTKEMGIQYHREWLCQPCRVAVMNGSQDAIKYVASLSAPIGT